MRKKYKKVEDNLNIGMPRSDKCIDSSNMDEMVLREELRKIMKIIPTEYLYDKENIALAQDYLEVFKRIKTVLPNKIEHNFDSIQTIKLTLRQESISDVILEYIIESTYERRDDIYHELYDFIDNMMDERKYLSYIEIVILRKLVNCIIYKLEKDLVIGKTRAGSGEIFVVPIEDDKNKKLGAIYEGINEKRE